MPAQGNALGPMFQDILEPCKGGLNVGGSVHIIRLERPYRAWKIGMAPDLGRCPRLTWFGPLALKKDLNGTALGGTPQPRSLACTYFVISFLASSLPCCAASLIQ